MVLEEPYDVSGGPNKTERGGWLQTGDLDDWYGVRTDSFGFVVVPVEPGWKGSLASITLTAPDGFEVYWSRGIPDREAWKR